MAGTTKVTRRVGTIAAAALLAAGVGGIAVARAQERQGGPTASTGPCAERDRFFTSDDRDANDGVIANRAKARIGLTDQQAADVRAFLKARRADAQADRQALCLAQVDLRRLMWDRNSDPAAVKAAGDRVSALQAKRMGQRLDALLTLRSTLKLSAEQWEKVERLQREMGGRGPGGF